MHVIVRQRRGLQAVAATVAALVALLIGPGAATAAGPTRLTTNQLIGVMRAAVDAAGHRHIVYDAAGTLVYLTDTWVTGPAWSSIERHAAIPTSP